jgi:hypothetical protein
VPLNDLAIRRMGIDRDVMTGHGFRAMARTILDEVLGVRPDLIPHGVSQLVLDARAPRSSEPGATGLRSSVARLILS